MGDAYQDGQNGRSPFVPFPTFQATKTAHVILRIWYTLQPIASFNKGMLNTNVQGPVLGSVQCLQPRQEDNTEHKIASEVCWASVRDIGAEKRKLPEGHETKVE